MFNVECSLPCNFIISPFFPTHTKIENETHNNSFSFLTQLIIFNEKLTIHSVCGQAHCYNIKPFIGEKGYHLVIIIIIIIETERNFCLVYYSTVFVILYLVLLLLSDEIKYMAYMAIVEAAFQKGDAKNKQFNLDPINTARISEEIFYFVDEICWRWFCYSHFRFVCYRHHNHHHYYHSVRHKIIIFLLRFARWFLICLPSLIGVVWCQVY